MTYKVGDQVAFVRYHYGHMISGGMSFIAKINRWDHIILDGLVLILSLGFFGSSFQWHYASWRELKEIAKHRVKLKVDLIS